MQSDGNLVVYDSGGRPLWDAGTEGNLGAFMRVLDEVAVGVFSAEGTLLWSSKTG